MERHRDESPFAPGGRQKGAGLPGGSSAPSVGDTSVCGGGRVFRRCPTLPRPVGRSTIGAGGLSFRVRDGSGRFPSAVTTGTPHHPHVLWGGVCGRWDMHSGRECLVTLRLGCLPVSLDGCVGKSSAY